MNPHPVAFLDLAAMHAPMQDDLNKLWHDAVRDSSFIGGEHVARFERSWARYCGSTDAIGVANGTDALELVLMSLDIGPGDEVIIPANTFVATAEAVVTAGAIPVFVDVDEHTLLVRAEDIERAITPHTRAVMVVHLYGAIPEMDPIVSLCAQHDLHLIEDAAQAHGATHLGRQPGAFGIAATFSFYPGKNLGALGDGGAVVTNDSALAEIVRIRANHGRGSHLLHVVSGRNSRLDAIQAGALAIKLDHLDAWNERRRAIHERYLSHFADSSVQLLDTPAGSVSVHHLEVVRVEARDTVQEALNEAQIRWGVHYGAPCHKHPAFERFAPAHALPVTERAAARQLSLPMHPTLTDAEIDRVASVVLAAVRTA